MYAQEHKETPSTVDLKLFQIARLKSVSFFSKRRHSEIGQRRVGLGPGNIDSCALEAVPGSNLPLCDMPHRTQGRKLGCQEG